MGDKDLPKKGWLGGTHVPVSVASRLSSSTMTSSPMMAVATADGELIAVSTNFNIKAQSQMTIPSTSAPWWRFLELILVLL